ncbi:MAG TPA: peptidoglycan-binding domain-containing protein [Gemmatimonadaceae bacterium]|nr:peptidoglycan-binding domain-containing protein [Gemmatimonadaceae bacterium]
MRSHLACFGAMLLVPAFMFAQQPPPTPQDTTPQNATSRDTTSDSLHVQRSEGRLAKRSRRHGARNMGLTSDQVIQLQQALTQNSCDPGSADGVIGPKTRQAIHCIRQKDNITTPGLNPVLAALNLDFTVPGSGQAGGNPQPAQSDTTAYPQRDTTTTPPDTTAPPPDTATRPDTTMPRPDTTTPPDTAMHRDTSVVPDTSTTYRDTSMQRDTTMRPLRPDTNRTTPDTMMQRDTSRIHPDTSMMRPDTSMHSDSIRPKPDTSRTHRP